MSKEITEYIDFQIGLAPQDIAHDTATDSSTFFAIANYDRFAAVASCEALGAATDTLKVQLLQATDSSGTSKTTVGDAGTYTGAVSGPAECNARGDEFTSGYGYVGVRVTPDPDDDAAKMCAAFIMRGRAKVEPV